LNALHLKTLFVPGVFPQTTSKDPVANAGRPSFFRPSARQ
jgi:hypothetical protein